MSYMLDLSLLQNRRRLTPRAPAAAFCTEHSGTRGRPALVVDLSETGLRLQRSVNDSLLPDGLLPLEFEVPGLDEIVWAAGEVCFREISQLKGHDFGPAGFVRTAGLRLVSVTNRHRRMLRDYAHAFAAERWLENHPLMAASCYRYG